MFQPAPLPHVPGMGAATHPPEETRHCPGCTSDMALMLPWSQTVPETFYQRPRATGFPVGNPSKGCGWTTRQQLAGQLHPLLCPLLAPEGRVAWREGWGTARGLWGLDPRWDLSTRVSGCAAFAPPMLHCPGCRSILTLPLGASANP